MLFVGGGPDLTGGIKIQDSDSDTDDEVRPERPEVNRNPCGEEDGDVGQHVVSGGEERSTSEAASLVSISCEQKSAGEIDRHGTGCGE